MDDFGQRDSTNIEVSWDYMDKGVNKTNRTTITNIPTITIVIASLSLYLLFIYTISFSNGLFPFTAFVSVGCKGKPNVDGSSLNNPIVI